MSEHEWNADFEDKSDGEHAHERVLTHWKRLAQCEGNYPLIALVLRGIDPFKGDVEPETTDCEVDSDNSTPVLSIEDLGGTYRSSRI